MVSGRRNFFSPTVNLNIKSEAGTRLCDIRLQDLPATLFDVVVNFATLHHRKLRNFCHEKNFPRHFQRQKLDRGKYFL